MNKGSSKVRTHPDIFGTVVIFREFLSIPGGQSYVYHSFGLEAKTSSSSSASSTSCCSVTKSCPTLCDPMDAAYQASLSFTNSRRLSKFMSIEAVMLSNHLIFCCPLLLLPSIFSSIRVFSNESALHIRWAKYWSFGISPMNIQGLFPLGLTGLLSLQSKGLSRVFSNTTV